MTVYRVFNVNNVVAKVSDEDLDRAAAGTGALPTELANAAALAGRRDLTPRLLETLAAGPRVQKLAAARALLELREPAAARLLETRAAEEGDDIVKGLFTAIRLRLRGVDELRQAFEDAANPQLAGLIPSMYNRLQTLDEQDAAFLVEALGAYLHSKHDWIEAESQDDWRNAVFILLEALQRAAASGVLGRPALAPARQELRVLLGGVRSSRADRDGKAAAKTLLAQLEALPA
jgi:hypothetical protein